MFINVAVHGGSPSEYLKSLPQLRPFAARTKLIYLALIKKKKEASNKGNDKKTQRQREREGHGVFQRQFHSTVVNVKSILLLRNSLPHTSYLRSSSTKPPPLF